MKKFLCYDTEAAARGEINVDSRAMLKPIPASSGLPEGGTPYQQLVTDGDGNVKWEDRLAYEAEPMLTEIVPEETVAFSDMGGIMGGIMAFHF